MGVLRAFVGTAEISSDEGRGVAHFLQNSESEVFSVLHLGHSTPIVPFSLLGKRIAIYEERVKLIS
jgi:hypothetical protein